MQRLLTGLLATLSLTAWAAEEPLPNPILNPDKPWVFAGFSVNTPADSGWVSYFRNGYSAALAKGTEDAAHILGVNVLSAAMTDPIANAEDLVAQLNNKRPSLIDINEFVIKQRVEVPAQVNGYWCSQYTMASDTKNVQPIKHLHMQGLSCVNPANPKLLVDVAVSDLTAANEIDPQLVQIADRMLRTFKFLPRLDKRQTEAVNKLLSANDVKGALDLLRPLAEQGDSRAAFLMGDIYLNAKDAQDYTLARKWLEISASQGERDALYNLGVIYDKALGVERDLAQAVKWFKLAADQRDPQAQLNLGILHDPRADGFAKDVQAAAQWLALSANNGSNRAKQLLSTQYRRKTDSAPAENK